MVSVFFCVICRLYFFNYNLISHYSYLTTHYSHLISHISLPHSSRHFLCYKRCHVVGESIHTEAGVVAEFFC